MEVEAFRADGAAEGSDPALMNTRLFGVVVADRTGRVLEANEAFLELARVRREDIAAGRVRWDALVPPRYSPATARALREVHPHGALPAREKEYVRPDGHPVPVLVSLMPREDGRRLLAVVQDLTRYRHAEAMLRFLSEASQTLSSRQGNARGMLLRVSRLATTSVADACLVLLLQPNGRLQCAACTHRDPARETLLRQGPRPPVEPGLLELLTHAFAHEAVRPYSELPPTLQRQFAPTPGLRAALGGDTPEQPVLVVPLKSRRELLGVALLAPRAPSAPSCALDAATAEELGRRIGTALDNVRLLRETKQAGRRTHFLAEASHLLASSLDYASTLDSVARLAVPALGDWCAVDMVEEGTLRRVAVAHPDPDKVRLAWEIERRWPLHLDDPHGNACVIHTGQPQLRNELPDEDLVRVARDAEHLRLLRSLKLHSFIIAPLWARGRILGTVTFAYAESRRNYTEADLSMAADLAERAALAVDNARLYRAEQEAVHVRDAFLAVASHELKGPLTPLALRLQALQRETHRPGPLDGERVRGHLKVLQRQTRRLVTLVESLLDVSRIEAGTLQLDLEDVDLEEVVRDVVSRFEGQAAREHCALDLTLGEPLVGRWDRARLEQVVTHLLGNALKYGSGHPVHVRTGVDGDQARLTVRDEGIGIEPNAQTRIFGRFERAVPAERFGGLGLGLFLSRALVEALGGTIHVTSQPGRGAAFEVNLPLTPRD